MPKKKKKEDVVAEDDQLLRDIGRSIVRTFQEIRESIESSGVQLSESNRSLSDMLSKEFHAYRRENLQTIDRLFDGLEMRLSDIKLQVAAPPNPEYIPVTHGHYFSGKFPVVTQKPIEFDFMQMLGREGRYGRISSDDGQITVRINESNPIDLNKGETHPIAVEENMHIKSLRVTTDSASALNVRVFIA